MYHQYKVNEMWILLAWWSHEEAAVVRWNPFPVPLYLTLSDVGCLGTEFGPMLWETSSLGHEPLHGPVSLERYANRAAYYSEWIHVVIRINHRIIPVRLPDDKKTYIYK